MTHQQGHTGGDVDALESALYKRGAERLERREVSRREEASAKVKPFVTQIYVGEEPKPYASTDDSLLDAKLNVDFKTRFKRYESAVDRAAQHAASQNANSVKAR